MNDSNNSSLNVVESTGFQVDPSQGLKQGAVSSELVTVAPIITRLEETTTNTQSGLSDPLHRDTLVTTQTLSTTDVVGVIHRHEPGPLWFANTFIANRLIGSFGYTGGLVTVFNFNVPPGACGTYIISALPNNSPTFVGSCSEIDGDVADDVASSRQGLHAIIDMSASTSCEITLPWLSNTDFQNLTDVFDNWRIVVYCLSPLQLNGGASGTATYTMYVRGHPTFKLLIPSYQAGKVSEVLNGVSNVADSLAKFSVFEPFMRPVSIVASLASRALSALGFTRHTDVAAPLHVKHVPASNITCTDGNDSGTVLALSNANTLALALPGGADPFDNMLFEHLFPRPTLVHSFVWSTADGPGTYYTPIGVSPFWVLPVVNPVLPVAGYIGLPFNYWRGTMHYEVIISCSALMRGTLQIFWSLRGSAPGAVDITNTTYNIVCDIENNHSCRFEVGYQSKPAMLENTILSSRHAGNAYQRSATNGTLGFKVLKPLTSMGGSAAIRVSIFSWADADMRFAIPRSYIPETVNATPTATLPFDVAITYQSGTLGSTTHMVETYKLVPRSKPFSVADFCSGEEIASVRPLLQKFSRYFYNAADFVPYLWIVSKGAVYLDHFGGVRNGAVDPNIPVSMYPLNASTVQSFNWFKHYALLYDSMAGSTRYKVFGSANLSGISHPLVMFTPEAFIVGNVAPLVVDNIPPLMTDFTLIEPSDTNNAAEFTIPYYNQDYSIPARYVPTNNSVANIEANARVFRTDRIIIRNATTLEEADAATTDLHIFTAGGPDSKFNTFRRVPHILVQPSMPTVVSWTTDDT